MAVHEAICCTTETETSYMYLSTLPPVCFHCGKIENVLDDTNPCILLFMDNFLL
jgi:hypothetical protein